MTTPTPPPGPQPATDTSAPPCPYVGLAPFEEDHAEYFFGRDRDSEIIVANLTAAQLTLLYAPSGVGKSSVLRAGVVPRLKELAAEDDEDGLDIARSAVAYVSQWSSTPLEGAAAEIGQALAAPRADPAADTGPPLPLSLEWLRGALERSGVAVLYLVLDQFEEYLFYYPADTEADGLTRSLSEILTARDIDVHVLLSVREDALAGLDRFKGHVPQLFGNYLRLAHLDDEAARSAIEGPVEMYNRHVASDEAMSVEPELVERLLEEVRTGKVVVGREGAASDALLSDGSGDIATPYLQLVLTRLWEEELSRGSRSLRRRTLDELGGAQTIVQCHLDNVIAGLTPEQVEVAAAVFHHLVTASGSKIALTAADLADWSGQPAGLVQDLLETLSSGHRRILRPVPPAVGVAGPPRYEIFHDVMGAAVLDWRLGYVAAQERAEAEAALVRAKERAEAEARAARRELRRTRLIAGELVCLVVIATAGLVAVAVMVQRSHKDVRVKERMATYEHQIGSDPVAALHTALQAYRNSPEEGARAVRTALAADFNERTLRSDHGRLASAEFSADGSRIVTASDDGTAQVMDAATGRTLATIPAETGTAPAASNSAQLSPDGSQVVTASGNGRIRVASARTGQVSWESVEYHDPVRAGWGKVAGRTVLLASAYYTNGPVGQPATLYDPANGQVIRRLAAPAGGRPSTGAYQASLSPDGSRVVAVGRDPATSEATLGVWDAASGRLLARSGPVGIEARDPHFVGKASSRIAFVRQQAGLGQQNLAFWTWARGSTTQALQADSWNAESTSDLAVSPDGRHVAIGLDKFLWIYDADTGEDTGFTPEQPAWVNQVRYSPDGQFLASAGADGQVRVWRPTWNSEPIAQLIGHQGEVDGIAFHPTDRNVLLSTSQDGTAKTWRLFDHRALTDDEWVLVASPTPDGSAIVTGQRLGYIKIWRSGGQLLKTISLPASDGFLRDTVVAEDGNTLVGTASQLTVPFVVRWRDPGEPRPTLLDSRQTSDYYLTSVAISPDGRQVAAGNRHNEVVIWDLATRKATTTLPRLSDGSVMALSYLGTTGRVVVASTDGTVRIWDPAKSRPQMTLEMPGKVAVRTMMLSPDQSRVVTLSEDHLIRIWRVADGRQEREIPGPAGAPGRPGFSADGSLLALGASDGTVHVYDWRAGRELGAMHPHGAAVNDVRFLPDGRLLSASDDRTAAIYPCTVCLPITEVVRRAQAKDQMHQRR